MKGSEALDTLEEYIRGSIGALDVFLEWRDVRMEEVIMSVRFHLIIPYGEFSQVLFEEGEEIFYYDGEEDSYVMYCNYRGCDVRVYIGTYHEHDDQAPTGSEFFVDVAGADLDTDIILTIKSIYN